MPCAAEVRRESTAKPGGTPALLGARRTNQRKCGLEYGPPETLPRVGAMLTRSANPCRPRRRPSREHPGKTRGFSTSEGGFRRETDWLAEGRVRTFGPP